MAGRSKPNRLIQLLYDLQHKKEARPLPASTGFLDSNLVLLKSWQADRLSRTYADLLEDVNYSSACHFFLDQIYAPRDFSQRDLDFERLHSILSRYLPEQSLRLLSNALALNQMTNDLDLVLLNVLVNRLGMADSLDQQKYAEGYRLCDNYSARARQIDLIARIVREVGIGARLPLVGITLRLARGPANRAGWVELYDFLEQGYAAFKSIPAADTFAAIIEQREIRILDRIFAHHPDPLGNQ